jgi:hypothetical protein
MVIELFKNLFLKPEESPMSFSIHKGHVNVKYPKKAICNVLPAGPQTNPSALPC